MNHASHKSVTKWLTVIPASWRTDRLKDVVPRILGGGTPASSEPDFWDEGQIVWLTPTDFGKTNGSVEISGSERRITQAGLDASSAHLLPKGTVIMASRATIGTARIAGIELATNQGFISFVCDESRLQSRFLYYVIEGYLGAYFAHIAPGTTFNEISRGKAKQEAIGFPDVREQRLIVAYLDRSCAAVDAALAAKRRQLETLDAIRKAIITRAVTVGVGSATAMRRSGIEWIGKIPRHWRVDKLKYLTSLIVDGTHVTPTYVSEGVPFLRVTDIQDDTIDLESVKYISPEEHRVLSGRAKAQRGDMLLSKNGTIGLVKVVTWDWEFSFFVSLCLIRPGAKLDPHFFSYFFASSVVDQQLFESSKQTSVTNLHLVKIRELRLCVPPLDEQKAIVEHLDSRCGEMRDVVDNIESQIATLHAYRNSLIHECVTGQRRVTEEDLNKLRAHG